MDKPRAPAQLGRMDAQRLKKTHFALLWTLIL
jgi:hypothetical protein